MRIKLRAKNDKGTTMYHLFINTPESTWVANSDTKKTNNE